MGAPKELVDAVRAAMDTASRQMDTWRCPHCGSEAQWPGDVHVEWGSPDCWPCSVSGQRVEMELVKIEAVN